MIILKSFPICLASCRTSDQLCLDYRSRFDVTELSFDSLWLGDPEMESLFGSFRLAIHSFNREKAINI